VEFADQYSYRWYYSPDSTDFVLLEQGSDGLTVGQEGYYVVYVVEPGCHFESPTPFRVLVKACDIRYPNIITPNGDSKNDTFEIEGILEYPGSTLIVYNRWGKVVYESNDYRNSWNGADLPEGVYYFIAEINKSTGKEPHAAYFQLFRK